MWGDPSDAASLIPKTVAEEVVMNHEQAPLVRAAEIVRKGHVIALTGAGVSTESGIPDFRSKGGLWERFDPYDYAHIASFRHDPERVWTMLFELRETLRDSGRAYRKFDAISPIKDSRDGRVAVKDLTFQVPGRIDPIVSDMSFELEPGERIIIAG